MQARSFCNKYLAKFEYVFKMRSLIILLELNISGGGKVILFK